MEFSLHLVDDRKSI